MQKEKACVCARLTQTRNEQRTCAEMEREMLKYGVYAKGVELLCFKHALGKLSTIFPEMVTAVFDSPFMTATFKFSNGFINWKPGQVIEIFERFTNF